MPKIDAPDEVLDRDGRLWLRDLVPAEELRTLKLLWELHDAPGARVHARTPLFNTILNGAVTKEIVRLWPDMRPVRLVAFDKTGTITRGQPAVVSVNAANCVGECRPEADNQARACAACCGR